MEIPTSVTALRLLRYFFFFSLAFSASLAAFLAAFSASLAAFLAAFLASLASFLASLSFFSLPVGDGVGGAVGAAVGAAVGVDGVVAPQVGNWKASGAAQTYVGGLKGNSVGKRRV